MKSIQAARLAQAQDSDYQKVMTGLQGQINMLEFGEEKIVEESWNELKKMNKG